MDSCNFRTENFRFREVSCLCMD